MIDYTFFMGLDEKARLNLIELGYDEEGKHDCCNGHYYDYDWSDFDVTDGYGDILSTFASLGYNETSWNDTSDSLYENSWWDALPLQVQYDAYDWLCFNKELWNEVELPQWPRNATLPGMYKEDGIYDYYDVEEETKEEKKIAREKKQKRGTKIAREKKQKRGTKIAREKKLKKNPRVLKKKRKKAETKWRKKQRITFLPRSVHPSKFQLSSRPKAQ